MTTKLCLTVFILNSSLLFSSDSRNQLGFGQKVLEMQRDYEEEEILNASMKKQCSLEVLKTNTSNKKNQVQKLTHSGKLIDFGSNVSRVSSSGVCKKKLKNNSVK